MAASYDGNVYQFGDLKDGDDERLTWRTTWAWQGKDVINKRSITIDDPNLLVPGDILRMPGHAVIVLNVEFEDGKREIKGFKPELKPGDKGYDAFKSNVRLIEAAQGEHSPSAWKVLNSQSWGESSFYRKLTLKRLR